MTLVAAVLPFEFPGLRHNAVYVVCGLAVLGMSAPMSTDGTDPIIMKVWEDQVTERSG